MTHPTDNGYRRPGYGRWEDIFSKYIPRLIGHFFADGKRGPCPKQGCRGTFKLDYGFELEGYGKCDACMDREKDGIGLLMHFNDWSRPAAERAIISFEMNAPNASPHHPAHRRR